MSGTPATYEQGSGPLQTMPDQPNFTDGRVKAEVPKLGNTYSVEMWVRDDLPIDSRPVTAYLFSHGMDGADGAPGDNLGIGGTHSNCGQLFVFNGNRKEKWLPG